MAQTLDFDLQDFLPYLLNQAAEATSLGFQPNYKEKYGMLRTEWRVLFHLGRYGTLTAKEICARAAIHKTKVSRAVNALEEKRFLTRTRDDTDRRREALTLTKRGGEVFDDLYQAAQRFDLGLVDDLTDDEQRVLRKCLKAIAGL